MERIRQRLTFANVMSVIAVFVALGGTGYAAITLPKNSVKAKQIAKNAVRSPEVKNRTLRAVDFKRGQLPRGQQGIPGPQGLQGIPGQNGTADAYARVQADGALLPAVGDFPATSKGITQDNVTKPEPGVYCIDLAFRPASAMVALDNAGFNSAEEGAFTVSVATERGNNINPCTGTDARVRTVKTTNAAAPAFTDHPFVIWFEEG